MKKNIKKIWNYLFEIFIWFIYLWMGALSIACTYILPKEGTFCIVGAILLTFAPKVYKRFKNAEEE